MKKLIIVFFLIPAVVLAQKQYREIFEVGNAEQIFMNYKWPDQVTIKYHKSNAILIEGTVSINYGQYDDSFRIFSEMDDRNIRIRSEVQGIDTMEQITVIKYKKDDKRILSGNDGNYTIISGDDNDRVSSGVMMDIFLTIYLPENIPAKVEAKFGLIEIKEIEGPLIAHSKFGGVDLTIDQTQKLDLKAGTAFGDIFTDLQANFRGNGELNKTGSWHRINTSFSGGGGQVVEVESKFGNIYLRKK